MRINNIFGWENQESSKEIDVKFNEINIRLKKKVDSENSKIKTIWAYNARINLTELKQCYTHQ